MCERYLDLIDERIDELLEERETLVEEEGENRERNLHRNAEKIKELRKLKTKIVELPGGKLNKLLVDKKSYQIGMREGRKEILSEFEEIVESGKRLKDPLRSEIKDLLEKTSDEGEKKGTDVKCQISSCKNPADWAALCTGVGRCKTPDTLHLRSPALGYCSEHVQRMASQLKNDFVDLEKWKEGETVYYEGDI